MAKNESQLVATRTEEQLLSKWAIALPPKERLKLLLSAEYYPIVKKGTSAEAQIKEMIDFYNLCTLMLVKFFPNEKAEANYIALTVMEIEAEQQTASLPISTKLSEAFKLVRDYEDFERKITAIRNLFWKYSEDFPEVFEEYNLEDIAGEKITDMLGRGRYMVETGRSAMEKILKRWELL